MMSQKVSKIIMLGWMFICLDIGRTFDLLDDGIGFLLIGIGIFFMDNKDIKVKIAFALSVILAPFAFYVSLLANIASPSWTVVFLRCIPPIASLPIGIILSKFVNPHKCKNPRRLSLYFVGAQIFDISCIVYFVPLESSMVINDFNTSSIITLLPALAYIVLMIIYISAFRQ